MPEICLININDMETREIKFKTNINCSGCVSKVNPFLDNLDGVESWEVNTTVDDKVLTVKTTNETNEEIIDAVEEVGFFANKIEE